MNTTDKAPSPKILLNKLGNLKATLTQSAIALEPKVAATNNSLANPNSLESIVKKATIIPDLSSIPYHFKDKYIVNHICTKVIFYTLGYLYIFISRD